jgi:hypothetical protein
VYAPATLRAAWGKVQAKGGAAGVDGVSVERFAGQAEFYLGELARALRDGSYRPQPVRRVEIAKGDGRTRPPGIPAVKLVIEPVFEGAFCPASYGFRRGRGCKGDCQQSCVRGRVDHHAMTNLSWNMMANWVFGLGPWDCQESCVRGRVDHHAMTNLSSNMMANWVLASAHSSGGIFHSAATWRKTR